MPKNISPGDVVRIKSQGITVEGVVHSASNYNQRDPETDCWYIEVINETTDLVHYWKQDLDGGEVEVISRAS
jgi:hypothetical protein